MISCPEVCTVAPKLQQRFGSSLSVLCLSDTSNSEGDLHVYIQPAPQIKPPPGGPELPRAASPWRRSREGRIRPITHESLMQLRMPRDGNAVCVWGGGGRFVCACVWRVCCEGVWSFEREMCESEGLGGECKEGVRPQGWMSMCVCVGGGEHEQIDGLGHCVSSRS